MFRKNCRSLSRLSKNSKEYSLKKERKPELKDRACPLLPERTECSYTKKDRKYQLEELSEVAAAGSYKERISWKRLVSLIEH